MDLRNNIKVHIGCGNVDFGDGWIHIDKGNFEHVKWHDPTCLPFEDESAEIIYASHILEYYDKEVGKEVLAEWFRVLKTGGILRLAVPDFSAIVRLYNDWDYPLWNFLGPLYGKMEVTNKDGNIETIYHKTCYDFSSLGELLKFIGFRRIMKYNPNDKQPTDSEGNPIDDCSFATLPHFDKTGTSISLNLEAIK